MSASRKIRAMGVLSELIGKARWRRELEIREFRRFSGGCVPALHAIAGSGRPGRHITVPVKDDFCLSRVYHNRVVNPAHKREFYLFAAARHRAVGIAIDSSTCCD